MTKKTIRIVLGVIATAVLFAGIADAKPKTPKKPVVCYDFQVFKDVDSGETLGVCLDNEKAFVMPRFAITSVPGEEDGSVVRVMIGWRK